MERWLTKTELYFITMLSIFKYNYQIFHYPSFCLISGWSQSPTLIEMDNNFFKLILGKSTILISIKIKIWRLQIWYHRWFICPPRRIYKKVVGTFVYKDLLITVKPNNDKTDVCFSRFVNHIFRRSSLSLSMCATFWNIRES